MAPSKKTTKVAKGLSMMKKAKTTTARADEYFARIKSSIFITKIAPLREAIANKKSKIFDLEDMSLATNRNKGVEAMTKESIEERFVEIIKLSEEIALDEIKLKVREDKYEEYLGSLPTI